MARFLLVEPNNTGALSDDSAVHLDAALKLSATGLGGRVADQLGLPMLMPVFPRPHERAHIYTHLLDRDTLEIRDGPMRRLDLQLLAMIDDARRRLAERGMPVEDRVLLTGFSASAKFANRFAALHPRRVRAVAAGGNSGLAILPLARLDDRELPYPVGVADLPILTDAAFDKLAWDHVPQFLFMGVEDTNDAVAFDDGFSDQERALVYEVLGKEMLPARWSRCRDIHSAAGAAVIFETFPGIGHGTNGTIRQKVAQFFMDAAWGAK